MDYNLKTNIATRLMDYVSSGKHPLRPRQVKVMEDIAAHLDAGHDYGYVKRPTGTGKTVNYIAEIAALGMPALIITPRTNLTTQIHNTFLNRELFDFDPEQIGVYHGHRSYEEKSAALKAPILITTFASYARLSKSGDISGKERPLVFLDEVHHARGDVVRPLVRELFGDVYVQGWTATDTFMTGQNIGYYLFNRRRPIHVTTIAEAVENEEITPYKNIIVETHMGSGVKVDGYRDYTPSESNRIVRQAGRDEAAISMFLGFYDEETGLRLRDMKSIWYCAGVDHAERVADKLTDIFGENYALSISGQTPKGDLEEILNMHRRGEIPGLVNADLLIEGFDSASTQLAMMLRPTNSPIVAEQTGGRVLRIDPNNPNKLGYIVTFVDEGMYDVVPFGVVAGNIFIPSKSLRFYPSRITRDRKADFYDFPELSGMEVRTSQLALEEFVRKRNEYLGIEQKSRGLPQQQINEIIDAHETYGGNALETSRQIPYSFSAILKYWREAGLEIAGIGWTPGKPRLTQQQIDDIIQAHETYQGDLHEASKHLPNLKKTIKNYWEKSGLEVKLIDRWLTQQQIDEIISAHSKYDGNATEASRHLHFSPVTILKHWKSARLQPDFTITPFSDDEVVEIINAFHTYNGNADEAARHLSYSHTSFLRYWNIANLTTVTHDRRGNALTQEQINEIINAHETYGGVANRASKHILRTVPTILKYWREAGLKTRKLNKENDIAARVSELREKGLIQ